MGAMMVIWVALVAQRYRLEMSRDRVKQLRRELAREGG